LALGRRCIVQPFKVLVKHNFHRSPERRIAVVSPGPMLGQPFFQAADRRADIVRAVGAA